MSQLLVNNFTILSIEEYNKNYSNPSDISVSLPCDNWTLLTYWPKWKKDYSIINDLNTHGILLYLYISLETTNISKTFSLYALVDFGAIRVFINRIFVEKYYLNTYKLKSMLVMIDAFWMQWGLGSRVIMIWLAVPQ